MENALLTDRNGAFLPFVSPQMPKEERDEAAKRAEQLVNRASELEATGDAKVLHSTSAPNPTSDGNHLRGHTVLYKKQYI